VMSSSSAPAASAASVPGSTPGTVVMPPSSGAAPAVPAAPQYVLTNSGGVWDPAALGAYTCPQTKIAGYCIVPDVPTAQSLCTSDPKCLGYAIAGNGSGTIQLLASPPVPNPSANGTYYKKS
jgi:hypothetical protein